MLFNCQRTLLIFGWPLPNYNDEMMEWRLSDAKFCAIDSHGNEVVQRTRPMDGYCVLWPFMRLPIVEHSKCWTLVKSLVSHIVR